MRRLTQILLVCLLLAAGCVMLAPFSTWGSRQIVHLVDTYTPLEASYERGSFSDGLELEYITFPGRSLNVRLSKVSAQLDLACLWRSIVCFESLRLASLYLDIPRDTSRKQETRGKRPIKKLFEFPIAMQASELVIGETRIHWAGGQWYQGAMTVAVRVEDSRIEVRSAEIASPSLSLVGEEPRDTEEHSRVLLPAIDLPVELSVQRLVLTSPAWDIYGNHTRQDALELSGQWKHHRLEMRQMTLSRESMGSLTLEGALEFKDDWPLNMSSVIAPGPAIVAASSLGKLVKLDLEGDLARLEVHLETGGHPVVALQGRIDLLDPELPFTSTMRADSEQESLFLNQWLELPPQLAGLAIELPWNARASGTLAAQEVQIGGNLAGPGYDSLALEARLKHQDGEVGIERILLLDEDGHNHLEAKGTLLTREQRSLALSLDTSGFDLPGLNDMPAGRLQGSLALHLSEVGDKWAAMLTQIDLVGDINGLAARAQGSIGLDQDWSLQGSSLEVEINGTDISLQAADDDLSSATLSADVTDIGRWEPSIAGSAQLHAHLLPAQRELRFTGQLKSLLWSDLAIEQGEFNGHYRFGPDSLFEMALQAEAVDYADLRLQHVTLTGKGDRQRQHARLLTGGDISGEFAIGGLGWGDLWRGTLGATSLETIQGSWHLPHDVELLWGQDDGQLSVADHCWLHARASVCAEGMLLGASGKVSFRANGALASFDGLLPEGMGLQGDVKIVIDGQWREGRLPAFSGGAEADAIVVTRHYGDGESAQVRWDRLDARLEYTPQGLLVLRSTIHRQRRQVLAVDLDLSLAARGDLAGSLSVNQMQLGPLIAFAPALADLRGELSGDLRLSGTRDRPLINGELRFSEGAVGLISNPTPLDALQFDMRFLGRKAELAGSGELGSGPLIIQGELVWMPQWLLTLQLEGDQQNVLFPPATEMMISEQLQIVLSPGLLAITGDISIHEGSLEPEVLPEGSVAVSSDVVVVDSLGNVVMQRLPFDVSVDVRVRLADRFKVSSSLLAATLGGDLHVLQPPGEPLQLFGRLSVIEGEVRAYQRQLLIERGTLSFSGRPDNPAVNVRAVRYISGSNVTAGILVRGSYDDLRLEVFSEPVMPQGEAMSYLLRGRGVDASAGEDGTALALSVASGVVNRSTLVSELNRIPGVSDVSFGAEGSAEDTAATVSGYIGERIYLSYGIGVYEPINVLIARIYLRSRLWLEVVSRLENSLDLYYSFDID